MSPVRLLLTNAIRTALIVLGASTALVGCGNNSAPGALPCVEGSTAACVCPGGSSGGQICQGGAFGLCDCGSAADAALVSDTSDAGVTDAQTSATDAALPGTDAVSEPSDAAVATDAADTDAVTGSDADAAGADAAGTVACASDKDCKDAGKICDPLTKACVDCLADSDCGPLQHCKSLWCVDFTPCSNSLGCVSAVGPGGEAQSICDPAQAECVACLSNNDCPANNDCVQKSCVPFTPCVNSKDCLTTEVCNTAIGRCAQCLGNNDCGPSQLCESGQCRDYVACASDKQCTPLGLLCDPAKGKCAQCLGNADCPAIYHCTPSGTAGTGVCTLDVCAQGQGACSNNAKVTCNAVGDGFTAPVACPAQTTCVAPGGKPECKPWVCAPGVACDGNKALACSGDGFEVLQSIDCAANAAKCVAGACQPIVCEAGQVFCDGQTKKVCSQDGLYVVESQPCGSGTFCEAGQCKPQLCAPGSAVCSGNTATLCNDVGSGFASGGTPCGTELCVQGACKPLVCVPNGKYCAANVPKTCNADGTAVSGVQACGAGTFCDAGECKAQLCTPDAVSCNGNAVQTCNAQGSGYTGTVQDCGSKALCVAGKCEAKVCEPASIYCDGAVLKQCAASGLSATTKQTCGGTTFCGPAKTGDAGCQPIVCNPGADTCNGKIATRCNVDGSGYEPLIAIDCATSGNVCSAGACVSLLCDPLNPLYCDGNVAKKCDATGLSPSTLQTCGAGFYCAAGACSQQICTPGSVVCSANKPATCNAAGSGYVDVQAECAAGTTCSAGQCLAFVCGDGVCGAGEAQQCPVDCQCVGAADGELCDDDNFCTKADTCSLGSCVGALIPCDDGYAKSTDSCDPVEGCKHQWPEVCDGKDNDVNGTTDDVVCGSGACTCGADGVATCPADCTVCPDDGDLASLIDDGGIKKVVCAHDYPAWGIVAESPKTFTDNGDGTVSDSKTGLMWQLAIGTGTYTWANAKVHCDNLTLASKQDWRLPTLFELVSLVDFKVTSAPTIAAPFVASTPQSEFWSSSSFQGQASQEAGSINFSNGGSGPAFVTSQFRARCVRASGLGIKTFPSNRRYEVDVSAKTVYDKTTGLTWQQEVPLVGGSYNQTKGLFNWGDAANYCAFLELGGKSDWRLPGVVELSSLLRRNAIGSPGIDVVAFPQIPAGGISRNWSATPYQGGLSYAWIVDFNGGGSYNYYVTNNSRVRCVR